MRSFIASLALSLSFAAPHALAMSEQAKSDLQFLRTLPKGTFNNIGAVCEEIARVRLATTYPATDYSIVTGIEYEASGRTMGELDVVVFQKTNNVAVLVGEVKCWRDLPAAHHKAMEQLQRFKTTVERRRVQGMHLVDEDSVTFRSEQFNANPKFITIAQGDCRSSGFDMCIGIDLDDVSELYKILGPKK